MSSSFSQKTLRVTFTTSNNAIFPGDPNKAGNVLQLTGLRVKAAILCKGAPAFPECQLMVYGMALSDMNALSSLTFEVTGIQRNTVQVEASDGGPFTTVYIGQITNAHIDYSGMPEVGLRVFGQMGFFDQLNPAPPTSYTGSVPVATVISRLCATLGYQFENNGVTAVLSGSPYFAGTLLQQIRTAVEHAGIDQYMEAGAAGLTVAICPRGAPRAVPTFNLSPSSGLEAYPQPDALGQLHARSLYNSAFRFGGPLTISGSDVVIDNAAQGTLNTQANGSWMIGQMSHMLESETFDGAWFTDLLLYPPGRSPPQ